MPRELPIVFRLEMHRAIREKRKTQTRRPIKRRCRLTDLKSNGKRLDVDRWHTIINTDGNIEMALAKYHPGDLLWVREGYRARVEFDHLTPAEIGKRVGKEVRFELDGTMSFDQKLAFMSGRLRSPIHMWYWAARTWLEVTGVRAERLQDISEADVIAEGVDWMCEVHRSPACRVHSPVYSSDGVCTDPGYCECGDFTPLEIYERLWESINGKGSWAANPHVWVYSFRRIDAKP